jgi:branched-chain amino acid aminotransferase
MINFNGELISSSKEILTVQNRAFKYGDGLFETIKVINGSVCFLEDHYFRLMASMRMLRMEIPMNFTMEFFESELLKTVRVNNLENARVRCTVYRENGGLYTPFTNKVEFIIEVSVLKSSVKTIYTIDIFKDYFINSGLLSTLKTTNKLTNVLAGIFASENELDNCILLNERKFVVEAINGNIFVVKGTNIKTPALSEGSIKGIARKKVIEFLTNNANFAVEETSISPFELQKADEIFITNAIIGIQPITNYKKTVFKTIVSQEIKAQLNL